MSGGQAIKLPGAAGYDVWLLQAGSLDFEVGIFVPDRAVTICVNALLLRGHGETILIDAGSGPADVISPGAAELDSALQAASVGKEEVDTVVLTHLDFDHAGGALAGSWPGDLRPAFPRVVISAVDYGIRRPGEPDDWDVGTPITRLYESAGRLERAADGAEIRPGLRLASAPGHRPGHCVVLVGDELVYAADILHHEAHIEHPEWDASSDADVDLALATRRSWIARLAEAGTPAVFSHLPTRGRVLPVSAWQPDD